MDDCAVDVARVSRLPTSWSMKDDKVVTVLCVDTYMSRGSEEVTTDTAMR